MSNYLNNIPDSEIEGYALTHLAKIKQDLLDEFSQKYDINEGQSITGIIAALGK